MARQSKAIQQQSLEGPRLTGCVTRTHGRHHYVTTVDGNVYEAHRRGKKSDVVVGDIVICSQPSGGVVAIESIEPRTNLLYRSEDVPALELFKRGHEHFKLRYLLVPRKQGTRFDIEQVRGHLDKLTCDFKIHALHFVKIFKVLIENIRDADIADLYFVFRQEEQDQAQRAFKILKLVLIPDNALQKETGIIHYRSLIKQFYDQIAGKLSDRNQI